MTIYHNTRDERYRKPFGAAKTGSKVRLRIDVRDEKPDKVFVRSWEDGIGETLYPMELVSDKKFYRFECEIVLNRPEIFWYCFKIIKDNEEISWYGACEGLVGGVGETYNHEPPSFQITVYNERKIPAWYKHGIAYQIFPDRFNRGEDWRENAKRDLETHKKGPNRVLVENWEEPVGYVKDGLGRVVEWDFYGGTLSGITDKLDYLKDLGISIIYLNPIFDAASNHRYDTGDYFKIAPMLGDEESFKTLCAEAEKRGIGIILDGVFNHTGCDSIYFNKYGNYDSKGAFNHFESPYRSWYTFNSSHVGYESWWGVGDLPSVNELNASYRKMIYEGEDSVVRHWLRLGAKGFRLDVADELPDVFIEGIKNAIIKEKGNDGVLIGEVWEDASNKVSYGVLRKYLLGSELDSVMNYPLRNGILGFITGKINARQFSNLLISLYENYPKEAFYGAFNLIGSHDRMRILTVLGEAPDEASMDDNAKKYYKLDTWKRQLAIKKLWLAVLMQMTMPGVPCIYYGDEAGMEGYSDPYNRGTYPWGKEDKDVRTIYNNAIEIRTRNEVFADGKFEPIGFNEECFGIKRENSKSRVYVIVNRSPYATCEVNFKDGASYATNLFDGKTIESDEGVFRLKLGPLGSTVIYIKKTEDCVKELEEGSGIICHITSLPGGGEHGCIGDAFSFIDFLKESGQKYWQILPLHPTDHYGSPYAGMSAFAGNIDLADKSEEELRVDFERDRNDENFLKYIETKDEWLKEYALYRALCKELKGDIWQEWPEQYKTYKPELWEDAALKEDALFYEYEQYYFDAKWKEVRKYAEEKGIKIIGDMPMFVAPNSAEVWAHRELFTVDEKGYPSEEAGVPPDYFSIDGQNWGNPLYNWDEHKKSGYDWWMKRFERMMELYDYVRLDHFRGFDACYAIEKGKSAKEGKWKASPGHEILDTAVKRFGKLSFIAEDLGLITPCVRELIAHYGLSGMDVIQFYDGDVKEYECQPTRIAYSGTHDNETIKGWAEKTFPDEKGVADKLLERLYACDAKVKIVPLQDAAGLGDESRMNMPGTTDKNWSWRASFDDIEKAKERLKKLGAS